MKDICNELQVTIFDDAGNVSVREKIKRKLEIREDCQNFGLADFWINETCVIRKKNKVEITEDGIPVFKGYIYDHNTTLGNKYTEIKANSEKWFFRELYPLDTVTYTGPFQTIMQQLLDEQNSLYNQFTFEYTGSGDVTLDIPVDTSLFDIFDSIANQLGLERNVNDGVVFMGYIGKDSEKKVISDGNCDNKAKVKISEGLRYSRIIGVDKNGNTVEKSNYVYGNLGTLRKTIVGDLETETQKCLDKMLGENYVYEVELLEDIDVNICDTIDLCVSGCGAKNFNGKIKVQQKKIVYEGCVKKVKYVVSNGEIQRVYGYFTR